MRFPYGSMQTVLAITRKILPVPIWRQKPRECIGKMPCLGFQVRENLYLIIFWSSHPYKGLPAHALPIYLQGVVL